MLENREMLSVAPTLAPIDTLPVVLGGAPVHIALDGYDADGDDLTYTVDIDVSANPDLELTGTVLEGNRSLRMSVEGHGDMILELFEQRTPQTTARIIELAESGFYDGVTFHRILENFMIQGGDPDGNGTGGSGVEFDDEFHPDLMHTSRGILSMANGGWDTNDSQWFITAGMTRHLDFKHTVFGFLAEGEDVRQSIAGVEVEAVSDTNPELSKPVEDVVITSIDVFVDKENGVLMLKAPPDASGQATVTVTVSDGNGGSDQQTFQVVVAPDTEDNKPFLLPIDDIYVPPDGSADFVLPALDVEGDAMYFDGLVNVGSENLTLSIDNATGSGTVTTSGGIYGVHSIYVGVRADAGGEFDTQNVPVFVAPPAPSSVDLLHHWDTGISDSDNLTRLNNKLNSKMKFEVSGVMDGALVTLLADGLPVGQATASGASVIITTDGTTTLSNGSHTFTATQTLPNLPVNVGNRHDTVDLTSAASSGLPVVIDNAGPKFLSTPNTIANVGVAYSYDVQTDEESLGTAVYELTTAPTGMSINATTGVISWTPQPGQEPQVSVHVKASDPAGADRYQRFDILVAGPGGTLSVLGTVGDDLFEFVGGPDSSSWIVKLNGVAQAVPAGMDGVEFDGQGGNDTVKLTGAGGADAAEIWADHGTLTAADYEVTVVNVESITIDGAGGADEAILHDVAGSDELFIGYPGGGQMTSDAMDGYAWNFESVVAFASKDPGDIARFYDSPGKDEYICTPQYGHLIGDGFAMKALGFDGVHAYATAGGFDVAKMYDSEGDDHFYGSGIDASLYGDGYYNRGKYFEQVHAYASHGGYDDALLRDTAGDDTFYSTPDEGVLYGDGYLNRGKYFDIVVAEATAGGHDVAYMMDSAGDDTLITGPVYAELSGDGFKNIGTQFDEVYAYASEGYDLARMYDSPGDDQFNTTAIYGALSGDGFHNQAEGFDSVNAYATAGGKDLARMFDSAEDDTFYADPIEGSLYHVGYYHHRAKYFEQVHAYATAGGHDVAYLVDSAGNDTFYGDSTQGILSRQGVFYNRAKHFEAVYASGSEGNDLATLVGSAEPDLLEAEDNWARLSCAALDYLFEVSDFDKVSAAANGAEDTSDIAGTLAFDLEMLGP